MSYDNSKVIEEFRANNGIVGGRWAGVPLVLVHHVGARSGSEYVTPLAFFPQADGRLVVVASAGGSRNHPDWYYNLKANPRIEIEIGGRTFKALAEELGETSRAELWPELVADAPQLDDFQNSVTRRIPVLVLSRRD